MLPALASPCPHSGYPPLTAEELRFQEVKWLVHSTIQGRSRGGTGPQAVTPKASPPGPCPHAQCWQIPPARAGPLAGLAGCSCTKALLAPFFVPWSLRSMPLPAPCLSLLISGPRLRSNSLPLSNLAGSQASRPAHCGSHHGSQAQPRTQERDQPPCATGGPTQVANSHIDLLGRWTPSPPTVP